MGRQLGFEQQHQRMWTQLFYGIAGFLIVFLLSTGSALAEQTTGHSSAATTALTYINALETGGPVTVGQLDFQCLYEIVSTQSKGLSSFPDQSSPYYQKCFDRIQNATKEFVVEKDEGVHMLWPGAGKLLFFGVDLNRYAYPPSVFVSTMSGKTPEGGGFSAKILKEQTIPPASFRLHQGGDILAAPATLFHIQIAYHDPMTSPASYAPGTYQWVSPVKRPRAILKAVTIKVVVLSNLKKIGFPGDQAVVNQLVTEAEGNRPAVPLLTENSGYLDNSAEWWGPSDSPDHLAAAIRRATAMHNFGDRIAIFNRVLLIDPDHVDALTALSRDLYQGILKDGAQSLPVKIGNKALADRFLEFYWDTYAQHERVEISLGMEMGGFSKPTTADYLFRMIPAMEKLTQLRPNDLETQSRLGTAYRWNLDQLTAIETHDKLVRSLSPEQGDVRARALIELAWSKITKVAFNRTFDDPGIRQAHGHAQEALALSATPLDKFSAAYTMAYSLVYTPDRDNKKILAHLMEAKEWYFQVEGSTAESWRVLVENATLKPIIDSDPAFKQLVATRS